MVQRRYYNFVISVVLLLLTFSCAPKEEIKPPPTPAKIAVVLGAGASKGFAHIGVLKVLEANKIPVHMIVGTSAGSFVGSLYAFGYSAFQLQEISFSIERSDIIDFGIPDKGFIKGDKLEEFINKMTDHTLLENLRIPFYAVATNIQDGSEVIFSNGSTATAVRASCSIPGIFRPAKIGNTLYADGGIVSPVAVDAAKKRGADVVIAIDISSDVDTSQPEGTIDMILKSITIMHSKIAASQLYKADVVIRPKVGRIASGDFTKRHEAVLEGEKAATLALPEIQHIIDGLRHDGRL
ncbi:MAG: patatin-like phospholipase family protein [Nitrospiraceae bacterium]|nr:MAG: patatin-like phospholipase family protein [Nitrospiraceae bacterium]